MNTIAQILSALLPAMLVLTLLAFALILAILWVARGESDVNGDPERDAGYTAQMGSMPTSHPSAPATRICSNCHQPMINDAEACYPDICPPCMQRMLTEIRLANHRIESHL